MKKNKRQNEKPCVIPDFGDARVGDIALSLCGHDAGSLLIIVAGIDESYVLAADGKRRKLAAPKKKKMQHLRILSKLEDKDAETLRLGKANDSFLRKKLSAPDLARFT